MEARVTKAARFRQGLGVLGETPVFARTRRRYARPPSGAAEHEALMSSLRLTISMCHSGTFATTASTCHPLQPPSAQTRSSHGKRRRILSGTSPAQSRSWIAAEWTTTRIDSPSLSTKGVDFAALHLLAGAVTYLVVFAVRFSADLID